MEPVLKICRWCNRSALISSTRGFCETCELASDETKRTELKAEDVAAYNQKQWPPPGKKGDLNIHFNAPNVGTARALGQEIKAALDREPEAALDREPPG
jgi:hypothetical protein